MAFGYMCGPGLEHGYIEDVMVSPEHQGKGLGTQLIQALLKEAKAQGLEIITLSTEEETYPFYQQLGFESEVSCIKFLS